MPQVAQNGKYFYVKVYSKMFLLLKFLTFVASAYRGF